MEMSRQLVSLASHMMFIIMSHRLLLAVFDWTKLVDQKRDNQQAIKLLLIFLSIAVGYLVSNFLQELITISRQLLVIKF